jgi:Tol biopolymer transport system component
MVAFEGTADLTGGNPSHLVQIFVIHTDGTGLRQLTQAEGRLPSLSGDGALVAFVSAGDPLGENPQHRQQLFLMRTDGTGLQQLTHATSGDVGSLSAVSGPALSAEGTMVAFTATADLTGGNPDGSEELFVVRSDGSGLRQLTVSSGVSGQGSFRPSLSADGTGVAFDSNRDLTGGNPDQSSEIFIMQTDGTGVRQLTSSRYTSVSPSLSGDGGRVAFASIANLTGENPYSLLQIFLVHADGSGLMQVTHTQRRFASPT